MAVREIHVRSFDELHERLFADTWDAALGRHRSPFAYRGAPSVSFDLATAVVRLGPRWRTLEAPMLRAFQRYARRLADSADGSVWSWLAIAQHHGLPTRLLDWTFSPYVALHFLAEDAALFDRDGVVWAFDFVRARALLPRRLLSILDAEGANVFAPDMLERAASTLSALDELAAEPFVVFLEPPSIDDRIVNQHALFSLTPSGTSHERILVEHPELARKIVVPAALKWEIRDKLDQANVNERVLYPGLDGLSRWLARYYTPRRT
jgi:hypothetical protein